MNKPTNIILKLDGPAIEEGIDLFELAPALLSLGNLIKESNKIIYSDGQEIGVNIKPFDKGSFIVEILLFAKTQLQQLLSLANTEQALRIKTLLEWLGIIKGSAEFIGLSLFGLIKFLNGKPKNIEKTKSGDVIYTNTEDNSVTVNINVDKLFNDCSIQKNFYSGYGKLLEQEGIEEIESYIKDKLETKEIINKTDAMALRMFGEVGELINEEIKTNESVVYLNFKRGSFNGDPSNWSFTRGNNNIIVATIRDEIFINKLKSGEIRPYNLDLLKVKLREKQRIRDTELLEPYYEVIEVLEYEKAPAQEILFNNNDFS